MENVAIPRRFLDSFNVVTTWCYYVLTRLQQGANNLVNNLVISIWYNVTFSPCKHVHLAQHVKDSTARMPYSKILHYGIRMEGLPSGMVLKNPTAYGKATLQEIIANKDALKLHDNIQ